MPNESQLEVFDDMAATKIESFSSNKSKSAQLDLALSTCQILTGTIRNDTTCCIPKQQLALWVA